MTFGVSVCYLMDMGNQDGSWVKLGEIMMFLMVKIILEESMIPTEFPECGNAETSHQAKSLRGADDL